AYSTSSSPSSTSKFVTGATSNNIPSLDEDFSSHSVIRPKIHHARHKRELRHTLDADGLHASHITLTYHHKGQKILIDLKRNDDLLPSEHFLRYQNSNTTQGHVVKNFTKTEIELCHYQASFLIGSIRDQPQSYVAVSTCNGGINGIIFDGIDTFFIHSGSDGQLYDEHFLYRHGDFTKNTTCGYDHEHHEEKQDFLKNLEDNKVPDIANHIDGLEFNRILRHKRSYDDSNMIRGPYNSNKHSSYVEIVIVVDNKAFKSFNENIKKVHQHCKDLANIMNALYVPLNIFIALVGVVIWNESNEIEITPDADVTLRNFLNYRRTKLVLEHPNDSAQLLTKIKFDKGVVGKAFKGPICTHEYSGSVSVEHSPVVGVVATTMAHELGHNFGMEHDSSDCKCQDEKCIMSASSTSVLPTHWSSCSIDQLNIAFSRGMNYCLRNKPTKLFDSPQCGNGFVEPGEQCDCGLPNYCENTCCDPYTCMLHTNASCATGECCDLTTCRPKVAGTECRNAENECDLPEYCTGESEYCPRDVFKRDTEECDNGQAYCYQGNCRSHSYQCRILWGPTGENSEPCYAQMNVQGQRVGNCGYNRLNSTYIACEEENALCGMLHCRHLNEKLEFGMETAAVLSHSFITHDNNIVPCRSALVDLGLQFMDPGLTPNGAKCGDNKMCVDQKCLAIEHLRYTGMGKECPENCNGNGICNSKGNCHCNIGFTGPTCKMPGPGGSVDSGPATNPNSHEAFQRFLYIFFFAVLPIMAAFCFFMYYCRHHPLFVGGKLAENMYVSNQKHGLSFSTSSYTTVTPNICKSLNSPSSSTTYSSPSTSSSTSTFKCNSSLSPKTSVKLKPTTTTLTKTATKTPDNTTSISNKTATITKTTLPLTIIKNTTISCTTTPKLSTRKSHNNLHTSVSNENFSKFTKQTNLTISKSHNEIATTNKKPIMANITKPPHINTKIQAILKPPPPPPSVNNNNNNYNTNSISRSKKKNSSATNSTSTANGTTPSPPPPPTTATTTTTNYNNNLVKNINVNNKNIKTSSAEINSKSKSNTNSNTNQVNTLRRKFEITDVRLNSTTNPLALVDGTTYTINDETNSIKSASGAKQPPRGPHANSGNQMQANGLPKSTPSSTDDMNSALLKSPSDSNDNVGNGGLYGKFKGFTLRPLNDATSPTNNFTGPNVAYVQPTLQDNSMQVPQRAAPPPPLKPSEVKLNGTLTRKAPAVPIAPNTAPGPALPPPNPGSTARPIISMPVLENSTLTMSPTRPAPTVPEVEFLKPAPPPPVPLHNDPKLNVKRDGTIRRITSFLKKEEKVPPKEKTYIDREKLKNLEISAPIPLNNSPPGESSNSDSETLTPKEEETKNLVKRAQSMRSPTKKANIPTFGSMRQTAQGQSRPKSAVSSQTLNAARPKSPPPRPPPLKKTNSTTSSGYQLPIAVKRGPEHTYDDCEFVEQPLACVEEQDSPLHRASTNENDNIYSVIDEIPPAAQTIRRSDLVGSQRNSVASSTDMGLLGEIVNEIEKRNGGDSIYSSTATNLVKQKSKDETQKPKAEEVKKEATATKESQINTNTKTSLSTTQPQTSYLRPAPVNAPIARVAPTRSDISPTNAFSSFKPPPHSTNTAAASSSSSSASASAAIHKFSGAGAAKAKTFGQKSVTQQKTLPANGVANKPSATIQKPKPLSAKPSFNNNINAKKPTKAPTAPTTTAAARSTISGKPSTTVASLTQKFEPPSKTSSASTITSTTTSLRK
ncbi:hypothetical protein FF38_03874, partial [Lucilia cuprina]